MGVITTYEPTCYTIRYPGYKFGFTNNKPIIDKARDWQEDTAVSAEFDRWHVSPSKRPLEEQITSRRSGKFKVVFNEPGFEEPDFCTAGCKYENLGLADY